MGLKSSANKKTDTFIPHLHSICPFFGSSSDVLGCDWRRNFFKDGDGFSFS